MTLLSFLIFVPVLLSGSLVVHLLWPEKSLTALLLKFFLGIGLGLGINSIIYFLVLILVPGRVDGLVLQILLLIVLLTLAFWRERGQRWGRVDFPRLSGLQVGLAGSALLACLLSLLIFTNYIRTRPQGEYDAWSIWNRAARFIYRDPENWRAALSPEIYWANHADYPLLMPLNVAWGWEVLDRESLRIPMIQAALFTFSVIGLMFAALTFTRTVGQASLAVLILMAAPNLLSIGSTLIADVPVAYFLLASGVLMYQSFAREKKVLLVASGFMAGLAGWTKNEGLLFMAVSPVALLLASPTGIRRSLTYYLAGMAIPLMVILYFKTIAPANDLIVDSSTGFLARITDVSRYVTVLKAFGGQLISFWGWTTSIVGLAAYALLTRNYHPPVAARRGLSALVALFVLQLFGYMVVYVLTPRGLEWQIFTSLSRVTTHILPLGVYLYFSLIADPEVVFSDGLPGPQRYLRTERK